MTIGISLAVEGYTDEGVAHAILSRSGLAVARTFGKRGRPHLLKRLGGYNAAARRGPWFVLVDLDRDSCAADARRNWLPNPEVGMCFRIAVPEVEAWLLADQDRIASFLGVPHSNVPSQPEQLADPKLTILSLARGSRKRDIRTGLVPRDGSRAQVGPTYASDLRAFAVSQWRPAAAAANAPSLARCLRGVEQLAARLAK